MSHAPSMHQVTMTRLYMVIKLAYEDDLETTNQQLYLTFIRTPWADNFEVYLENLKKLIILTTVVVCLLVYALWHNWGKYIQ